MENKKLYTKRANTATPQRLLELGKLPPQAIDMEEAVLGTIMQFPDALEEVIPLLKSESFYAEKHQIIYAAIERLFHSNQSVDILTTTQELKKSGELEMAGNAFYITQLTNRVSSGMNVVHHALIIKEMYMRREIIRSHTEVLQMAYDDTIDVFELVDTAEASLTNINEETTLDTTKHLSEVLHASMEEIEASIKRKGLTGIASGYPELDNYTGGWQPKTLVIVAARPKTGKSTWMLNDAINGWEISQAPCLIFEHEMSNIQLGKKIISTESDISYNSIRKGKLDSEQILHIKEKIKKLNAYPIYIEDTASMTTTQIKSIARKYIRKYGIKKIYVDYLQKVNAPKHHKVREQEVSQVVTELKNMAKSLNVPVIALCMLGRSVDERKDKIPTLADLRESGQIEAEADVVILIHRPSIYGIKEDSNGDDVSNVTKFIIAKNREGIEGEVKLTFVGDKSKFVAEDEQLIIPTSPV